MDNDISSNFTLYLILIISFILLTVDLLEIYRIILAWDTAKTFPPEVFHTCIKSELTVKTVFGCFSLLTAVCISIFCSFMIIDIDFFMEKVFSAFKCLAYFVFGPYMLMFSILGFYYWDDIVFLCDRRELGLKVFSMSIMFALVAGFIISLIVTITVGVYDSVWLHVDSVLRRPDGNSIIRKAFWHFVHRRRIEEDRVLLDSQRFNRRDQRGNIRSRMLEEEDL